MIDLLIGSPVVPHLLRYLTGSNWLATAQFLLFILIMYRLADRALRATGRWGEPLAATEPVARSTMESLARLCLGLGLLLTFSGLYGYIGNHGGDDHQSLLMALGSSAIGYSAWTLVAAAAVIDSFRGIESDSASPPFSPCTRVPDVQPDRPGPVLANDEISLKPYDEEPGDEQTLVDDSDCGSGPVGGVVCDTDLTAAGDLGSLDGYQRLEGAGCEHGDRPDPDLGPR